MNPQQGRPIRKVPFLQILLHFFSIKSHLLVQLEKFHGQYGDVFAIQADNLKCFIKRPDMIKRVLMDNHMNYEKSVGFKNFHVLLGKGLLTSDGAKWMGDRKVLNTEFSGISRADNIKIANEEYQSMRSKWVVGQEINFSKAVYELVVHTVCREIFRIKFPSSLDEFKVAFIDFDRYLSYQQRSLIKFPFWFPHPVLIRANRAKNKLRKIAEDIVNAALDEPTPNMIKTMLQNNFPRENILDHILTFFIAGHETTVNSLLFTMLLLRDNPVAWTKLKNEIDQAPANPDPDTLDKLEYLDCVIKESLRLFPTIPLFPRVAKEDDQLGEFQIRKGDTVALSPWLVHRSENLWPDALKFKPERFIGKRYEQEYIYFPFALGPRKCIGAALSSLNMKIFIFLLFKNNDFKITGPKTEDYIHNVSLAPASDLNLFLNSNQ
tara:strand:- start:18316 stop:19620 length:1305 start_codon:yes stop_codon:yes gene_type:complete